MNWLSDWGWTEPLNNALDSLNEPTWQPARVVVEHRDHYLLRAESGELRGQVSGRFRHHQDSPTGFPCVGDWVAVESRPAEGTATLHAVLPRRTLILRKEAGERTAAQALAANVDTVFLVTSVNQEFNARRMERFLALIYESGASPVIVLNKCDLSEDRDVWIAETEAAAPGVPVHAVSAITGEGMDDVAGYARSGRTVALLGSSGVGKSTLTNRIVGAGVLATGDIREDDARGRHTTSHRELVRIPEGGLLIDTPGLREVGLWDSGEGVGDVFADIESLAAECRFGDCGHDREPGCAVQAAARDGSLAEGRLAAYAKLKRELAYLDRRQNEKVQRDTKERWKSVTKMMRKRPNPKR